MTSTTGYSMKMLHNRYGEIQATIYQTPYGTSGKRSSKSSPTSQKQVRQNTKNRHKRFYDLFSNNFSIGDYFLDFTYAEILSVNERIAKREYIFKTKLPNGYKKYNSQLKYIGVYGFGDENHNYHDHVCVNAPAWCKSRDEVRHFFKQYAQVGGVTVHVEKIEPEQSEIALECIKRVIQYMIGQWYMEIDFMDKDGDTETRNCDIHNLDLNDIDTIRALYSTYDKTQYEFYKNYLDAPCESDARAMILGNIRFQNNLYAKIYAAQKKSKSHWFKSRNVTVADAIRVDNTNAKNDFLKCYHDNDYSSFVQKYFPDCLFYGEGTATDDRALTELKSSDGDTLGIICRITLVEKGSVYDYIKQAAEITPKRIIKYSENYIDALTGEVLE